MGVPVKPRAASAAESNEVSTVTPATSVAAGSASTAARTIAGPPEACTVTYAGSSSATERAAPATVAGMSCSLRSRNTGRPEASATASTAAAPCRR